MELNSSMKWNCGVPTSRVLKHNLIVRHPTERRYELREQTLTQKVGNRSGIGNKARSGAMTQRPARRERGGAESFGSRLRALLAFLPLILKVGLTIVVTSLAFLGYRAAGSARFFQIRNVEVQGTSRASNVDVQTLVRREVG